MGTWPFICSIVRSEPLCFNKWSQQLDTMNILLFWNSSNVAKLSHITILFCLLHLLFFALANHRDVVSFRIRTSELASIFIFYLFFLKSEIKVLKLHFVPYLWFLFALIPSFTAFLSAFFELLQMQREKPCFFFIIWFFFFLSPPPVFSAPCRIQWHSFLMRLLSLLISVSFGKNEWQSAL